MARFLLLGFNDARPGFEDSYNDWHANVHVKEVCAVPGVISARRYAQSSASPSVTDTRYLVVYEIEADDPKTVLAEFGKRARTIWTPLPPSADRDRTKILLFEECS